jgi:hypothetical protein
MDARNMQGIGIKIHKKNLLQVGYLLIFYVLNQTKYLCKGRVKKLVSKFPLGRAS